VTTKRLSFFRNNYLKSREADDCLHKFVLLVRKMLCDCPSEWPASEINVVFGSVPS